MRSLCRVLSLCLLALLKLHAQQTNPTDARLNGLAGPVKSVSTKTDRTNVKWQQPGGPSLLNFIYCWECDYDRDGNSTRSGSFVDGAFVGDIVTMVRNASGQITDEFVVNMPSRQLVRHDVLGPYGKIEETNYLDGKVQGQQSFRYDQYGHMTDWLIFDNAGIPHGRNHTERDADGNLREMSVWTETGELSYRQIFDPATKTERFTTFDALGQVNLTWTTVDGTPTSFWQAPGSASLFGDNFTETEDNGDRTDYECRLDSGCQGSHIHYEYLDADKRNLVSAEWRDPNGKLKLAVYYDYEIDPFRNWTSRRVWVWSTELGEPALYETDTRTIAYWDN